MKRNKIYNIVCAIICFLLWFMPVGHGIGWISAITCFISTAQIGWAFYPEYIRETLLILFGILAITLLVVRIIKENFLTKCFASVGISMYVVMWLIALFAGFSSFETIYSFLAQGTNVLWLILYFILLTVIAVLQLLQWLPPFRHRPTKSEQLEARIAELEQQVDELKKGE